jgi:hypothetical protein
VGHLPRVPPSDPRSPPPAPPAPLETAAGPGFFLDRARLRPLAASRRAEYRAAAPYPHAVFDGFLGDALALPLAARFPGPDHPGWMRRDYREQSARLGQLQRTAFEGVDGGLRHLLAELSGMAFLDFLGELTGTDGLIADPHFRGAGLSLTLPGGHLALHADFNRDRTRHLTRKLTVLITSPATGRRPGGAPSSCGTKRGRNVRRAISLFATGSS